MKIKNFNFTRIVNRNFIYLFFTIIFLLLSLKVMDIFLQKKFGLGNPVLYLTSNKHGYLLKPSQEVSRRGNKIVINNRGMRTANDWYQDSKKKKILFFGDSVTFGGSVVSNSELFTEKICLSLNEKFSDKFLCGNYGVNGYGLESITRLIKFRKIYDEDIIIVTIIANDLQRVFHNIASQPFWGKKVPTIYPAITEVFFIYLEKFKNNTKYIFNNAYPSQEDSDYYLYLIENLSNALEKSNKPYLIFYSPEKEEIFTPKHKKNTFIKNLLKKNLSNFFDLSEELVYHKNEFYHDSIHLNTKGHVIYGKIIYRKIEEVLLKNNLN